MLHGLRLDWGAASRSRSAVEGTERMWQPGMLQVIAMYPKVPQGTHIHVTASS